MDMQNYDKSAINMKQAHKLLARYGYKLGKVEI
jgi:hypothetical protein